MEEGRGRGGAKMEQGEGQLKGTPPGNHPPGPTFKESKHPPPLHTAPWLRLPSCKLLLLPSSPQLGGGGCHTGEGQGEKTRC